MNPLISVVVPIYNTDKYLEDCIKSIQRQTYTNLEIILVNDGSTDKSKEICYHYANLDSRILILNQPNLGVSSARNSGIMIAKGDYIGFVDSDDYIEEKMYEAMLNIIVRDNSDLCTLINFTVNPHSENKVKGLNVINNQIAIKSIFLLEYPTSLWAYLYSKKAIDNVQLDSSIHFFEDFLFNFEVLQKVNKISLCHENYYIYRQNELGANAQPINEKKMTCLNIYKIIESSFLKENKEYVTFSHYFKFYFIFLIIFSISSSKVVSEEHYLVARKHGLKWVKRCFFSRYVSLKYKVFIIAFVFFPKTSSKLLKNFGKKFQNEKLREF